MTKYIQRILLFVICLLIKTGTFFAQESYSRKVSTAFAYDVDSEVLFDNREFYKSNEAYTKSMTIFGLRAAPAVGLAFMDERSEHKLMLGVDLLKDFGAPGIRHDFFGYYSLDTRLTEKTRLGIKAGVFPRKFAREDHSEAFYSDSLLFYDNHMEGFLFRLDRPRADFELGIDWFGKFSSNIREKFMVYSSGNVGIMPFLDFGYYGYLYHCANTFKDEGVVDNILLNLWLDFSLEEYLPLQKFQIRAGWLQSAQHDRENVGHYVFPGGLELVTTLEKWNVGVSNKLYVGGGLMPYYDSYDRAGNKYGTVLYMGSPFYRNLNDAGVIVYDCLDVYYNWKIYSAASLKLALRMHFKDGYAGMQQVISIAFNLNEIIRRK